MGNPTIELNKNQLTSTSILDVYLPSGEQMLIISGIAIPNLDESIVPIDYKINLGVFARTILQSSVTVGIAGLTVKDTPYSVEASEANISFGTSGEVYLTTTLATPGKAKLNRFSYQVVLVTKTVIASVTGSVIWDQKIWNLPQTATGEPPSLVNQIPITVQVVTDGPGSPVGSMPIYTPVKSGFCTTYQHPTNSNVCTARFALSGLPFGKTLRVVAGPPGPHFPPLGPGQEYDVEQFVGPKTFILTPQKPETVVDFSIKVVTPTVAQ